MKKNLSLILIIVLILSFAHTVLAQSKFDFDWDDRNDMRGGWLMCATTGFTMGECPKLFTKCWQPPMIYYIKRKKKIKVMTFCTDAPNFSVEVDDINEAHDAARKLIAN